MQQIIQIIRKLCKKHKLCEDAARRVMGTITHVSTQDSVAALTFDDGPHPKFTPKLLDILDKHQAQATFFMIGEAARKYPELVRQVADAGHTIGNHSYSHLSFPSISRHQRLRQIRECQKAIAPFGLRMFRPPHGHQSVASRLDILLLRYQVVTWSVAVQDWAKQDVDWMVDQLRRQIQPGSIVLLHDSLRIAIEDKYADRTSLLEAINKLLERTGDSFRFITIPEMFRRGRPERQNWYRSANHEMFN